MTFQSLDPSFASSPYLYFGIIVISSAFLIYWWAFYCPKSVNGEEIMNQKLAIDNAQTRNTHLIKVLKDFSAPEFKSVKDLDSDYNYLIGYLSACEDHFDISGSERARLEGVASYFYKLHKNRNLSFCVQITVVLVILVTLGRLITLFLQ